jgi:hypothetical protein
MIFIAYKPKREEKKSTDRYLGSKMFSKRCYGLYN